MNRISFVSASLFVALAATFLVSACEAQLEPGYTECDGDVCSPGQYCDDFAVASCETGCTSEANCTEEEDCVKEAGQTIGSCVKASAGGGGAPQPNACSRQAAFDGECVAAGLPGAAYRCDGAAMPAGSGCELHPDQATYPGGYCCEA